MTYTDLVYVTNQERCIHWQKLMQYGVVISAPVGGSVRYLLENGLQFDHEYVEDRIQTVFVDGRPVDDVDSILVKEGVRVGLAAALPGAAEVAMRKNSPYAALRGNLAQQSESAGEIVEGTITLLLFNLIMTEKAQVFLEQGVTAKASILEGLFISQPGGTVGQLTSAEKTIEIVDFCAWCAKNPNAQIHIRVMPAS